MKEVQDKLKKIKDADTLLLSPLALEWDVLSLQRGSINTMIEYRLRRHLLTGSVPKWEQLDPETTKRLTKATRGKATDAQRIATVMKVHDYLNKEKNVTESVAAALLWLEENYGIFIKAPKTVNRWAKKFGEEW